MQAVQELQRHASPGGRPQPLAFHEGTLWVGCWDTSSLYAIDIKTWAIQDEVAAPGKPYGMASFGGILRVVISLGEDDDRYLYRFVPGEGFDPGSKTACPDFTGSHLASDGRSLYLTQLGNERILEFGADGAVLREIPLPSRCVGIGFGAGAFYMIAADEEFEEFKFATLDVQAERPTLSPIAALPPEARGLTFDGTAWWTSHRETNELASFSIA